MADQDAFHLNYILLGILAGLLYRNVIFGGTMPAIFSDGFKLSRLMIKTGIILLGSLYTVQAIVQLGAFAIFLIGGFVLLTIVMVLWLGKVFGIDRSMTGVLANALSICGVSAAVATSPAVEGKASHVAYAIATILGFGILTMFISPFIGHALGLTDLQYGAWIGTGILNSGQVLAAALAFNPKVEPGSAVSVAEIWNIMRVISIPFAVFIVTVWYWTGKEASEARRSARKVWAHCWWRNSRCSSSASGDGVAHQPRRLRLGRHKMSDGYFGSGEGVPAMRPAGFRDHQDAATVDDLDLRLRPGRSRRLHRLQGTRTGRWRTAQGRSHRGRRPNMSWR